MKVDLRGKLQLMAAEFFGTAMLATSVLVISNMFGPGTGPWYTALSAGATLMLIVGLFGHVSGAHVNPAVTVGMWTLKKISTEKAVLYIVVQFLGAAIALTLYNYVTGERVLSVGSSTFEWPVFVAEMVGAALFGMGIVAALAQKLEGFYFAFVIGASLTIGALMSSLASGGYINPAVALGNNAWDKTLAIAPIVGMVIGMNVYHYLFAVDPKRSARK